MRDRFLARQLIQLGLTVNAYRPVPGAPIALPAFVGGWLTAELAPHLATLTALDACVHTARHGIATRRDRLALAAAGANLAGYGSLIVAGQRARHEVEDALVQALGEDYATALATPAMTADPATPWRQLLWPFRMRNTDVVATRGLSYAPGGRRYQLDLYRHRDRPSGRPVLLQVHGGGWTIGTKEQQGIPLMLQMAARGWVCASINYPLSPRARWPEHLVAVKRAIAWIREHGAEFGADPSFLAVTGGSAGGHLAAMAALTGGDPALQPGFEDADTTVQACVPHYGVYDFTDESGTSAAKQRVRALLRPYVMAPTASYPDDYRAASPMWHIAGDMPPFFVIHGTHDTLVPTAEARAFVDKLRAASANPVAYAEIPGAQHAFDLFPSIRSTHVVRGVQRFLEWAYARERSVARPEPGVARRPA